MSAEEQIALLQETLRQRDEENTRLRAEIAKLRAQGPEIADIISNEMRQKETAQQIGIEAEKRSLTDPLTEVPNRRGFEEAAEKYVSMIPAEGDRRESGLKSLSIFAVDADHFKRINDTFGHPAGDKALKAIAKFLTSLTREGDIVGRMGGEEFTVALPDATAAEVLQKVMQMSPEGAAKIHITWDENQPPLTLSGAITEFIPGEALGDTLKRVDDLLYAAKNGGRDRIIVDPAIGTKPGKIAA